MGLKHILVFLDGAVASAQRFRLAATIAHDQCANLSAAFIDDGAGAECAAGSPVPRLGFVAQLVTDVVQTRRYAERAEIDEQQFQQSLRSFGGEGDWHRIERGNVTRMCALARTADLVILGQTNPHCRPTPWWHVDDVVVQCGRPALLVPYAGTFCEIGRRVLIAWDGSREAARALHDALPFMDARSAVSVICVRNGDGTLAHDREDAQRVIRHLARHDIFARSDHPTRAGNAIADVLLSAAMDYSADLIVAGAYHRSPMREALLGGVSRELLQTMTVPVLMSH
jgi:nucleotide-binding universal stress UspA family protein